MPATEMQKLRYRDQFTTRFGDAFQLWISPILTALYPAGEFQCVRKTQGDGGFDGFVINEQHVYQVYAPARINEMRDADTAEKIREDFLKVHNALSGRMRGWTFIHNHPEGSLGKKSILCISELEYLYHPTTIRVLSIDSLWDRIKDLPDPTLEILFGGSSTQATKIPENSPSLPPVTPQVPTGLVQSSSTQSFPLAMQAEVVAVVRAAMAEGFPGADHLKTVNQIRFERARTELLEGSIEKAERDYRDLIDDLEKQKDGVDRLLLFRCFTNLGSSLWQQFRRNEAVVYFERAYALKPEEPKAGTNKALCLIHAGDIGGAKNLLERLLDPANPRFDVIYLLAAIMLDTGNGSEAVQFLEHHPFATEEYFVALAEAYLKNEQYDRAESAARNALKVDPSSHQALVLLSSALAFPFTFRGKKRPRPLLGLAPSDAEKLKEAIKAAEEAVKAFRTQNRKHQLTEVLVNLSVFYAYARHHEAAERAGEEASQLDPTDPAALTNLWCAQMHRKKYEEAYATAGKLRNCGKNKAGKMRQLEALLADSQYERVITEAADDAAIIPALENDPRWFEIQAEALFGTHDQVNALTLLKDGLSHHPQNPALLLCRAQIAEKLGDEAAAMTDLETVEKNVSRDDPTVVCNCGAFYMRLENWKKAQYFFEMAGGESIYSLVFGEYVTCLFNNGLYSKCYDLVSKALNSLKGFNPQLEELAALSAYLSNDLRPAEKHFRMLVRKSTGKISVKHRKALANVLFRLDEPAKALTVLREACTQDPHDTEVLIGLASVSLQLKQVEDAMNFALKAIEVDSKLLKAHQVVVQASLRWPKGQKPAKRVFEAVPRSIKFLENDPNSGIRAVPIEPGLKSVIEMLKDRILHVQEIEKVFESPPLPIGMFANAIGRGEYETWRHLTAHPKLQVRFALGTQEEQIAEISSAGAAKAVSLDLFTLFSLRLTKTLHLLPQLFDAIYVHTRVWEAILQEIAELEGSPASGTIVYNEGHIEVASN
jgi:tetratricopeptide (TPR) repeat protein